MLESINQLDDFNRGNIEVLMATDCQRLVCRAEYVSPLLLAFTWADAIVSYYWAMVNYLELMARTHPVCSPCIVHLFIYAWQRYRSIPRGASAAYPSPT